MQDIEKIRQIIISFGFDAVGIAPYSILQVEKEHLDEWLSAGFNGDKAYMARHARHDPRIILPSCQSVVVALFSPQRREYHTPLRKAMKRLLAAIQQEFPNVEGRATVDTAPILERAWAVRAGLGAIGRNSMLVHPSLGSDVNIATLLLDVALPYDEPFHGELCATTCALCVEACPTGALQSNRTIDARKCLSYLSQQPGSELPWGCTICQEVCPRN